MASIKLVTNAKYKMITPKAPGKLPNTKITGVNAGRKVDNGPKAPATRGKFAPKVQSAASSFVPASGGSSLGKGGLPKAVHVSEPKGSMGSGAGKINVMPGAGRTTGAKSTPKYKVQAPPKTPAGFGRSVMGPKINGL
jgi:hypothetical protein